MNAADRVMFDMPLANRLQQPLHILKSWLQQTYITAKICIDEHTQKIKSGQKDIRQYFQNMTENSENDRNLER